MNIKGKKTANTLLGVFAVFSSIDYSETTQVMMLEMTVRIRAPRVAVQKPLTAMSGTRNEVIFSMSPLTTKVNSPRVRMLTGRVSRIRMGRKMAFKMDRTTAAMMTAAMESKYMPSTKVAVR